MIRQAIQRFRAAASAAVRTWREHGQTSVAYASITAPEAHVLRGLVGAGDTGILDEGLPMTEWRSALHSLAKKGMATAYRSTPLGEAVDRMVREGTIPLFDHESSADAAPKKPRPDWTRLAAERFRRDWEEAKKCQDIDNPRLFRGAPYRNRQAAVDYRQAAEDRRVDTVPVGDTPVDHWEPAAPTDAAGNVIYNHETHLPYHNEKGIIYMTVPVEDVSIYRPILGAHGLPIDYTFDLDKIFARRAANEAKRAANGAKGDEK